MTDYRLLISGIDYKVRNLLKEKEQLERTLQELTRTRNELTQQIDILTQQLRQYEENTRADVLATTLLQQEGAQEAKVKIDSLLEEIDQCIDLLNQ